MTLDKRINYYHFSYDKKLIQTAKNIITKTSKATGLKNQNITLKRLTFHQILKEEMNKNIKR